MLAVVAMMMIVLVQQIFMKHLLYTGAYASKQKVIFACMEIT